MRGKPVPAGGGLWLVLGLLLIIAALLLTSCNLYDSLRAERAVWRLLRNLTPELPAARQEETPPTLSVETIPGPSGEAVPLSDMQMPVKTVDGQEIVGILSVPSLGLELPILSQWSDSALKNAPCRYSGSVYRNDLILCGHNYTTHFGTLKNLREGDTVCFEDMAGNVFSYQVAGQELIQPDDPEAMAAGDWDLTLFTCTLGGKSRVSVRCTLCAAPTARPKG